MVVIFVTSTGGADSSIVITWCPHLTGWVCLVCEGAFPSPVLGQEKEEDRDVGSHQGVWQRLTVAPGPVLTLPSLTSGCS